MLITNKGKNKQEHASHSRANSDNPQKGSSKA